MVSPRYACDSCRRCQSGCVNLFWVYFSLCIFFPLHLTSRCNTLTTSFHEDLHPHCVRHILDSSFVYISMLFSLFFFSSFEPHSLFEIIRYYFRSFLCFNKECFLRLLSSPLILSFVTCCSYMSFDFMRYRNVTTL